jgi:hypothetical protein
MTPRTPTGFAVVRVFSGAGSEFDAPLAEGLMADPNAVLVQQFLHDLLLRGKKVVGPDGVLDDEHGEAVAVGLGVGHGRSAHLGPMKATRPRLLPFLLRDRSKTQSFAV